MSSTETTQPALSPQATAHGAVDDLTLRVQADLFNESRSAQQRLRRDTVQADHHRPRAASARSAGLSEQATRFDPPHSYHDQMRQDLRDEDARLLLVAADQRSDAERIRQEARRHLAAAGDRPERPYIIVPGGLGVAGVSAMPALALWLGLTRPLMGNDIASGLAALLVAGSVGGVFVAAMLGSAREPVMSERGRMAFWLMMALLSGTATGIAWAHCPAPMQDFAAFAALMQAVLSAALAVFTIRVAREWDRWRDRWPVWRARERMVEMEEARVGEVIAEQDGIKDRLEAFKKHVTDRDRAAEAAPRKAEAAEDAVGAGLAEGAMDNFGRIWHLTGAQRTLPAVDGE